MEKENKEKEDFQGEPARKPGKFKINLAIYLGVFFIFAGIILVTEILGKSFGAAAENGALIAIAVILVILLIRSKRS